MSRDIIDENFKKQVIFLLNNIWTGKSEFYFPLQNFINMERKDIFKLKSFEYFYYIKDTINTIRAALFLFKDSRGENKSMLVCRDLSIKEVKIVCPEEYYSNTVFDVSYDNDEVIIYDTFCLCGNKINYHTFIDRHMEAECFINNINGSELKLSTVKFCDNIKEVEDITEDEEIFMISNDMPIITGTNYSCFKWKKSELIKFSLKSQENESEIDLYCSNFKANKLFCKLTFNSPEGKILINTAKNFKNYKPGCILDINLDLLDRKLIIVGVNDEKTYPTSLKGIEKVITIKRENIHISDLY